MVNRSKVETFIGFAIKSRSLCMGSNSVATLRKAHLIILCDSASEGTKKTALSYATKFHCPLMIFHHTNYIHKNIGHPVIAFFYH